MKGKAFSKMMLTLLFIVELTLAFSVQPTGAATSEPPATEWSRTYGGTGADHANSVVQTSDGGYAIAGRTDSSGAGYQDFWLVKTDSSGNMQWNKTYGGANADWCYSVVQTSDGGYAMAGQTYSFGAGGFWLVKTDASGDKEWDKTYGGTGAGSVVQTSDGGYAIAGGTYSGAGSTDFWLVKTDSSGNHEWNKTYGGERWDLVGSAVQTSDGGYAIAGTTYSFGAGYMDFWLVKTDSSGNHEWNQTYGGESWDFGYDAVQTGDGGYAIAGDTRSFGAGYFDACLVKIAPEAISAAIDIEPDTLNLISNGEWVTGYIELPNDYDVNDIDVASIRINDTITIDSNAPTQIGDYDNDGVADLMVKFDRATLIGWLGATDYSQETGKNYTVQLTITGTIAGRKFVGHDTIKVLQR